MLNTIATTLVPVAFVMFLGYWAGYREIFGATDRTQLTKLVLTWLLPPLLIAGMLKTPRADLMDYRIPLLFVVGLLLPYLVVLLGCRYVLKWDLSTSTLRTDLLIFPDMVFMGVPILGQLFGPSSLYPILIANLVPVLFILPITNVLLKLDSEKGASAGARAAVETIVKAVTEPRVWLPFIGIALVLLDVAVPKLIISSLDLIGGATTAISLFVSGLIIAQEKVRLTKAVAFDTVIKNLVCPAVMLGIVLMLEIKGAVAKEAVLLVGLPSAVITTMYAEERGKLQAESSTTVLGTRVFSFVSIPILIWASNLLIPA
ncbi:MAG TPA: AEC family transporter [Candidatus Eisenbacteria bacterium]|nr:AEC family transporter [Candidatus Eisenbacteria bacterium]